MSAMSEGLRLRPNVHSGMVTQPVDCVYTLIGLADAT